MRLLITLMVILLPICSWGQTVLRTGEPSQISVYKGGIAADSLLGAPVGDTGVTGNIWNNGPYRQIGRIMVNDADSVMYYHNGQKWTVIGGGGGGGGATDTGFIRNQNAYAQDGDFWIDGGGRADYFAVIDSNANGTVGAAQFGNLVDHGVVLLIQYFDSTLALSKTSAMTKDGFGVGDFPSSSITDISPGKARLEAGNGAIVLGSNSLYGPDKKGPMISLMGALTVPALEENWMASRRNVVNAIFDSLNSAGPYSYTGLSALENQYSVPSTSSAFTWSDISISMINRSDQSSPIPAKVLHVPISLNTKATVPTMDILNIWSNIDVDTVSTIKRNIHTLGAPNAFLNKVLITSEDIGPALAASAEGVGGRPIGPSNDTFQGDWALKILGDIMYKNGDEGDGKILTSSADGKINIVDAGSIIPSNAFAQDGNAFGETAVLGTTDNNELEIMANNNTALIIGTDGKTKMVDGTQGDGKVIMSSADGTLSAQSADSLLGYNNAWINGIKDFGVPTQSVLGTTADTLTIRSSGTILMQTVGNRMAFNDFVRGNVDGLRFLGLAPSTGAFGMPITFEARIPSGGTGIRYGSLFTSAATNVAAIKNITVGRSRSAGPIYVGIGDENWSAASANTNYFMHSGSFQPSSTNWFLFGEQNVKSQLAGNLLLGGTVDNGHKLQVTGGAIFTQNSTQQHNQLIIKEPFTPASTADPAGETGAMAWDEDYIYIKTASGWKRTTLSTF